MDTSLTYIKMCEKATEIQAIWHDDALRSPPPNQELRQHYEKGFEGSFYAHPDSERPDGFYITCVDYEYETFYEKPDDIWLPRQDQLLEMVRGFDWIGHDKDGDLAFYDGWVPDSIVVVGKTMEQLWLQYVMHKKYCKSWNGTEWVKEK